ncbi:MAG: hypothetical protein HY272_01460 [Gammaproteobacteria bacterium]|nr:hypothetical protein [Gammaproteobacteria bacterium]
MKSIGILGTAFLATTLAACGGGGEAEPRVGSAPASTSAVSLTSNNAATAAGVAYSAGSGGKNTGGSNLVASLSGPSDESTHFNLRGLVHQNVMKALAQKNQLTPNTARAVISLPVMNCPGGGTRNTGWDDKDTPDMGDDIVTIIENNCIEDGVKTNGSVTIAFTSVTGDLTVGGAWSYAAKTTYSNFVWTEAGENTTMNGAAAITMSTSDNVLFKFEFSALAGGDTFTISDSSDTIQLIDFAITGTDNDNTTEYIFALDGKMASVKLGGSVTAKTTAPFMGLGVNDPSSGVMVLTGANNTKITMTTIDSTNVRLETDSNGDGIVDDTKTVTWNSL